MVEAYDKNNLEAEEVEQFWEFSETSKYGKKIYKPQSKEQEKLYWELDDAGHKSTGVAFSILILTAFLGIIILGYLLCNFAFLTASFNTIFFYAACILILMIIWTIISGYLNDKWKNELQKRVDAEIPNTYEKYN